MINFISGKVDVDFSSYFDNDHHPRQIINGAMKVITGLDWLGESHYPKNLIDFCLDNKPVQEGCIMDFVYTLYIAQNRQIIKKKK